MLASSSSNKSSTTTSFALQATLGYGCNQRVQDVLNKTCSAKTHPIPSSGTSNSSSTSPSLSELASSFFGTSLGGSSSSSSNNNNNNNSSNSNSGSTTGEERIFVASSSHLELFVDHHEQKLQQRRTKASTTSLVAALVPPAMIEAQLEKTYHNNNNDNGKDTKSSSSKEKYASGSCFWISGSAVVKQFSHDLLSSIHSDLVSCRVLGIIMTSIAAERNAPAEWVLLELPKNNGMTVADLLQTTNGQALHSNSHAILKLLPISYVQFFLSSSSSSNNLNNNNFNSSSTSSSKPKSLGTKGSSSLSSSSFQQQPPLIPTCPVCLHRIDPVRLGLPTPTNQQLCSSFCPTPRLGWTHGSHTMIDPMDDYHYDGCPKQQFLRPWKARCEACRIIHHYWNHQYQRTILSSTNNHHPGGALGSGHPSSSNSRRTAIGDEEEESDLFCAECAMHKTLWVCLTCGFVGCGRYSNKHSVQHFQETRHPYSLELATLRIWDYVHETGYAHRVDLLECPCSPPLAQPWLIRPSTTYPPNSMALTAPHSYTTNNNNNTAHHTNANYYDHESDLHAQIPEKNPKKATMIGEEYEALLQSALEDQAQHYEGEMARLRAELTASLIDQTSLTREEQDELEALQAEITRLRNEIDDASRQLLDVQAQEAGHRATSQRLLQEQQEANQILKRIQEEAQVEAQQGKLQVEDLEQQVRDLTANLEMRHRFSQSEELNEAQIFGTTTTNTGKQAKGKQRGKKKGRFFRI